MSPAEGKKEPTGQATVMVTVAACLLPTYLDELISACWTWRRTETQSGVFPDTRRWPPKLDRVRWPRAERSRELRRPEGFREADGSDSVVTAMCPVAEKPDICRIGRRNRSCLVVKNRPIAMAQATGGLAPAPQVSAVIFPFVRSWPICERTRRRPETLGWPALETYGV
jgi:hypothetical protein